MGDDFLNQSEVESLLSAIEGSADDRPATPSSAAQHDPRAERVPRRHAKVGTYDFKRPERVGKEQMRALQTLHESFGRNFGIALSALLRSIVDVKLTSVDQLTYSEFVFSLENPTCFNLINADPLESNLILDINPSIQKVSCHFPLQLALLVQLVLLLHLVLVEDYWFPDLLPELLV